MKTVAKPAGVPVFPPHTTPGGDCVLARLLADEPWRDQLGWAEGFAGGIAHRLDVSTSGALAVADDPEELAALRDLFSAKSLDKAYLFLAAGDVPWDANEVDLEIAHDRKRKSRMVVRRGRSTPHRGRWYPARTVFTRVRGRLWQAGMRTGVMHQIRVHAAFVGLALAGDRLYGGGDPPEAVPPGASFCLHHVGFEGAGVRTAPVPLPGWAA